MMRKQRGQAEDDEVNNGDDMDEEDEKASGQSHSLPLSPLRRNAGKGQDGQEEEEIDLEPFRSETNSTGYRGVSWDSSNQRYQAAISVNGSTRQLGSFDTAEEAAHAFARAYPRNHVAHLLHLA